MDAYARVALFALRDSRRGAVLMGHLDAWLGDLAALDARDLRTTLHYIWRVVGELRFETFRRRVVEAAPAMEASMGTIAEELEQRGERRGLKKGRLLALREMVERLATKRFGTLDETMRERIASAPVDELERAADRMLDAARPEDLFDAG